MNEVMDTKAETTHNDTKFPQLLYLFFGGVGLLIVFLLGLYFSQFNNDWGSQETFAQFGDFVGGTLNPVLGFATIALLVWSIHVQMRELRLTREEVAATKDEAEMSRKAMQDQVEHLKKEAKLSEITRLLKLQQDKYEHLTTKELIAQARFKSAPGQMYNPKNPIRYINIIEGYYQNIRITPHAAKYFCTIVNDAYGAIRDENGLCQNYDGEIWSNIENIALSIGRLTQQYLFYSDDSEPFSMVYLDESAKLLKQLSNLLNTSELVELSNALKKLATLEHLSDQRNY